MTLDEIHQRIASLASEMQDHYDAITMGLPEDNEGFPQVKGDLGDALKVIDHAISVLTRVAFKIYRDQLPPGANPFRN